MSEYEVGSSPWEMNLGSTSPVNLKFSSYLGRLLLSRSVMSNSLQPHGLQPAGLLCPWDFPGKKTGMAISFSMDLPQPRIHPASPALAGGFSTTGPPGKPI